MTTGYTNRYYLSSILTILLLFTTHSAYSKESIGKLIFTIGKVQISDLGGKIKRARRGTEIFQGDTIKTFIKGQAQIKFVDGARISIRAESEFKVNAYIYTNNRKKDKSEMSLIRGGIRAITGVIGKKNRKSYKMKTAVATIGIRGTDYSLMLCQSNCSDEKNENISSGLYIGVVDGSVTVKNKMGSITLDKNQYATVGAFNIKPRMLLRPPSFLMFDKTKATKNDKVNFSKYLTKKIARESKLDNSPNENSTSDKIATTPSKSESTRVTERSRRSSFTTSSLPTAITKRLNGESAQVPSQIKSDLKQLFSKNSDKLSAIDKELVEGLINEFENEETAEKVGDFLGQNSSEISKIEDYLNEQSLSSGLSSDVSGGCNSLFGSACDTFSGIAGTDPNSIVNNDNNPPAIGDGGNSTTSTWPVSRLPRFFISSLNNDNALYEYVESSDSRKITSFYQADSSDLTVTNYNSFGLETALLNDYGYDSSTGLSWGRWSDGNIKKTIFTANSSVTESLDYNIESLHWVQGLDGSDNIQLPITGTKSYTLIGNTRPTDNLGNVGTLGSASLFANFETNSVNADVTLSINQQLWRGEQQDIPLNRSNGKFFGNQLNIQVFDATGSTTGTGGEISGGLSTTPTSAGALTYSLDANLNGQATTVSGAAVFKEAQ